MLYFLKFKIYTNIIDIYKFIYFILLIVVVKQFDKVYMYDFIVEVRF